MRRSLSIGGSSLVQWRKVGRSWRLQMCFRRLLCVRIEIDQLQCVNCWVIIHCLSVSSTTINHLRCALMIWSSEIDQLQCVNCWVIIHCLSVSSMTINHLHCELVIWSSLQLTSKQWIITQQFTAGADLFLKLNAMHVSCIHPEKWKMYIS